MKRLALLLAAFIGVAAAGGCGPRPPTQERLAQLEKGPGGFFVTKGCYVCHNVSSFGIPAVRPTGPDLALAVEDAPRRFGMPVEEFLMKPAGTMAIVLTTRIPLTPEERALAARKLHEAYDEYQKTRARSTAPAGAAAPVAVAR
jgi:hypothetical protein